MNSWQPYSPADRLDIWHPGDDRLADLVDVSDPDVGVHAQFRRGQLAGTKWHFNGWAKYDNWQPDDAVPAQVAGTLGLPPIQPE